MNELHLASCTLAAVTSCSSFQLDLKERFALADAVGRAVLVDISTKKMLSTGISFACADKKSEKSVSAFRILINQNRASQGLVVTFECQSLTELTKVPGVIMIGAFVDQKEILSCLSEFIERLALDFSQLLILCGFKSSC